MKVLVTGIEGQLGHDVMKELGKRGHEMIGTDLHAALAVDLTDVSAVDACVDSIVPDAVIHCAAWTAVDAAEEPENEKTVWAVNSDATRYLAQAAARILPDDEALRTVYRVLRQREKMEYTMSILEAETGLSESNVLCALTVFRELNLLKFSNEPLRYRLMKTGRVSLEASRLRSRLISMKG